MAVLAAALGVAVFRKGARAPAAKPQEAVYLMLDAAREGDVGKYLSAYTGPMEQSLKQAVTESGEAAFARYLRDSSAAIKGMAIRESRPAAGREAELTVEFVYQDRNEVQRMVVEKTDRGWRIARADSAERVKTLIPYGTPVQ